MWAGLGQAATVAQLVGADVGGLISMIIQAAQTAQQNKRECEQLARHVFGIAQLLQCLEQDSEVKQRPEISQQLVGLGEALQEAYEFVSACQKKKSVYRFVMAGRQADRLREVQSRINSYLMVFPMITHITVTVRLDRLRKDLRRDDTTVPFPSAGSPSHQQNLAEEVPQLGQLHAEEGEVFTYAELAAVTNGFSDDTMIGKGGYRSVYRGRLPDGREVAIKHIVFTTTHGFHSLTNESGFLAERTILPQIRHKHIIRLHGSCVQEQDAGLLVLEYMENGSLQDHLHSLPSSPVTTSWETRIQILLGVSRAIECLHTLKPQPVIHRDIKPANILLDATWAPRLTDFGISLTYDDRNCMHTDVIGAIGYVAPEYLARGILKPTSDVYNFGVVMLEVLAGSKAHKGNCPDRSSQLPTTVLPMIETGELQKVLDMRPTPTPTPTPRQLLAVDLVARTAARCVRMDYKVRPAISEVVEDLEAALKLVRRDG